MDTYASHGLLDQLSDKRVEKCTLPVLRGPVRVTYQHGIVTLLSHVVVVVLGYSEMLPLFVVYCNLLTAPLGLFIYRLLTGAW